jgi:hypothetical protein
MQQEEVDVSSKALEQSEEISIPRQRVTKWTALAQVVLANTLEREIEPVRDLRVASAGSVNSLLSVNSISWEYHHGADSGADLAEVFVFSAGNSSTICLSFFHFVKVAMTASLDKKNSPRSEW